MSRISSGRARTRVHKDAGAGSTAVARGGFQAGGAWKICRLREMHPVLGFALAGDQATFRVEEQRIDRNPEQIPKEIPLVVREERAGRKTDGEYGPMDANAGSSGIQEVFEDVTKSRAIARRGGRSELQFRVERVAEFSPERISHDN